MTFFTEKKIPITISNTNHVISIIIIIIINIYIIIFINASLVVIVSYIIVIIITVNNIINIV